jgi:hypothetical protein
VQIVAPGPWATSTDAQTAALYKAVMLAPNLPTCQALLRGETVPLSRLDQDWVRKLGRR